MKDDGGYLIPNSIVDSITVSGTFRTSGKWQLFVPDPDPRWQFGDIIEHEGGNQIMVIGKHASGYIGNRLDDHEYDGKSAPDYTLIPGDQTHNWRLIEDA